MRLRLVGAGGRAGVLRAQERGNDKDRGSPTQLPGQLCDYVPSQIVSYSRSLVPRKGRVPENRICSNTPQLHTSTGFPYGCLITTSGDMK